MKEYLPIEEPLHKLKFETNGRLGYTEDDIKRIEILEFNKEPLKSDGKIPPRNIKEEIEYTFEYGNQTIKTKENSIDIENANFYQTGNSTTTPEGFSVTSTNPNIATPGYYGIDWKEFAKDKTLNNGEEEHCNVGVNKDWGKEFQEDYTKAVLKYFNNPGSDFDIDKEKRIEFECDLKFWQLLPSVAINLVCKEIEITWLCFGAFINWK